jgi:hypothetical protein
MAQLTADTAKRLERLPHDLHAEFPEVPMQTIEHDVQEGVRELISNARFTDYVPLLVHKTIRERLRATN